MGNLWAICQRGLGNSGLGRRLCPPHGAQVVSNVSPKTTFLVKLLHLWLVNMRLHLFALQKTGQSAIRHYNTNIWLMSCFVLLLLLKPGSFVYSFKTWYVYYFLTCNVIHGMFVTFLKPVFFVTCFETWYVLVGDSFVISFKTWYTCSFVTLLLLKPGSFVTSFKNWLFCYFFKTWYVFFGDSFVISFKTWYVPSNYS